MPTRSLSPYLRPFGPHTYTKMKVEYPPGSNSWRESKAKHLRRQVFVTIPQHVCALTLKSFVWVCRTPNFMKNYTCHKCFENIWTLQHNNACLMKTLKIFWYISGVCIYYLMIFRSFTDDCSLLVKPTVFLLTADGSQTYQLSQWTCSRIYKKGNTNITRHTTHNCFMQN